VTSILLLLLGMIGFVGLVAALVVRRRSDKR
jgi:ABC-type Fe3+-siderophore transport system permease subunit